MQVGRRVLYRIGGDDTHPTLRPADVVQAFPSCEGVLCNLVVVLDVLNDAHRIEEIDHLVVSNGVLVVYAPVGAAAGGARPVSLAVGSARRGFGVGEWRAL